MNKTNMLKQGLMFQGICIDTGQTTVLEKGKSYFLFPNGSKHFYVSKFPNKDSHRGCFSVNYFQNITDIGENTQKRLQNIEMAFELNEIHSGKSEVDENQFEQLSLFD